MPADDLLGRVALDALGARVPARDPALGVEHEDGVVPDALDQQAEALLALAAGVLGVAALGDVAEHQHDADDLARGVADRGGAVVDRPLAAVPGDQERVVRQPDDQPSRKARAAGFSTGCARFPR